MIRKKEGAYSGLLLVAGWNVPMFFFPKCFVYFAWSIILGIALFLCLYMMFIIRLDCCILINTLQYHSSRLNSHQTNCFAPVGSNLQCNRCANRPHKWVYLARWWRIRDSATIASDKLSDVLSWHRFLAATKFNRSLCDLECILHTRDRWRVRPILGNLFHDNNLHGKTCIAGIVRKCSENS